MSELAILIVLALFVLVLVALLRATAEDQPEVLRGLAEIIRAFWPWK